jgi:hypothetical protein
MSAVRDAIDRASAEARQKLHLLDRQTVDRLLALYADAARELEAALAPYLDATGTLRLEVIRDYLQQTRGILADLSTRQRELLGQALTSSAYLGAGVFVDPEAVRNLLAEVAVRFVERFVAADGLKLSDRLWRIDRGATQAIADALRRAVVMGRDASAAAADFLARGEAVPPDVRARLGLDGQEAVGRAVRETLTTAPNNAYSNALRVFRTELNRAHGQAYQAGAAAHPDVIGMKFNLSPNHPRVDICDVHAHANLYGLGPGVYPVGSAPWPAHPNTMSYLTAVFRDEVSAADRAGQQDALTYLRHLPADQQDQIIGKAKAGALRAGVLAAKDVDKPWKALKGGYERNGYEFG